VPFVIWASYCKKKIEEKGRGGRERLTYTLLLTTRKHATVLTHIRVVPVGEHGDEVVAIRHLAYFDEFLLGHGGGGPHEDVLADCHVEQDWLLTTLI
jgi:hypothetical protein